MESSIDSGPMLAEAGCGRKGYSGDHECIQMVPELAWQARPCILVVLVDSSPCFYTMALYEHMCVSLCVCVLVCEDDST
jgi:hypothetical protein